VKLKSISDAIYLVLTSNMQFYELKLIKTSSSITYISIVNKKNY